MMASLVARALAWEPSLENLVLQASSDVCAGYTDANHNQAQW